MFPLATINVNDSDRLQYFMFKTSKTNLYPPYQNNINKYQELVDHQLSKGKYIPNRILEKEKKHTKKKAITLFRKSFDNFNVVIME